MTTLGKILVFVNLAFSFITGALIIMVFVTRTNWKAGYDKLSGNLAAVREENNRLTADNKKLLNEKDAAVQAVEAKLKAAEGKVEQQKQEVQAAEKKLAQMQLQLQAANGNNVVGAAELQRRKNEVDAMEQLLKDREKKLADSQIEAKNLREQTVKAQIELASALDRNAHLVTQNETLARENDRNRGKGAGGTAPGTAAAKNPPPEDVRGLVKQTDATTGLVTISIGSDAGISVGNTLEAYRTKPQPQYLGTIRIMDVRHHEAVGKLISTQRKGLLQVGDEVASNILGQR